MKIAELMIGDWVIDRVSMPDSITKVDKYDFVRANACEFEPIILTEDILKANDFKRFEIKERFMTDEYIIDLIFMDKNLYCLSIDNRINEYYPYHIGLYIHYVHELQHALRLCGLTELADNFKIKED